MRLHLWQFHELQIVDLTRIFHATPRHRPQIPMTTRLRAELPTLMREIFRLRPFKKFSIVIASALALASCGGGGGGTQTTTTPPPGQDSATLRGTSTNPYGVRDEVQAALLRSYGPGTPLSLASLKLASFYQTWFDKQGIGPDEAKALVLEDLRLNKCLDKAATTSADALSASREIVLRTFNTSARLKAKADIFKKAGAFELPNDIPDCAL